MTRAFILAVALALLAPAAASAQALPDGSYDQGAGPADVYRIVGGAPLWINDCAYAPGCPSTQTRREPQRLPAVPARRDARAPARHGRGVPLRRRRAAVAQPLRQHAGLLRPGDAASTGTRSTDPRHVRLVPPDGTVVENVDDGGKYRFAGGAPLLVRCDLGPGCANSVQVDSGTFAALGSHQLPAKMRQYPVGRHGRAEHRGRRLLPLRRQRRAAALELRRLRGGAGRRAHAAAPGTASPPPRTSPPRPPRAPILTTGASTYRIAGGAALQLKDCTPLGGCTGAVTVDAGTIAGLGGGRCWPRPRTARVLRGCRPSGRGRSSAASGGRRSSRGLGRGSTSTTARLAHPRGRDGPRRPRRRCSSRSSPAATRSSAATRGSRR